MSLGVSRFTVREAIHELVHQGYLYRVQGNGTFVIPQDELAQSPSHA